MSDLPFTHEGFVRVIVSKYGFVLQPDPEVEVLYKDTFRTSFAVTPRGYFFPDFLDEELSTHHGWLESESSGTGLTLVWTRLTVPQRRSPSGNCGTCRS